MRGTSAEGVLELISAFRRSKTMFVAVSLGVFDRLEAGPAGAAELARDLQVNENALERLMDGCTGLGLLVKDGGLYANTADASAYLTRNSPETLAGYILYSDRALYPMWGRLEEAVRTGTNRWVDVFGGEGNIFDHFFRTPEAKQAFISGMHGMGRLSSPEVVRMFNLNRFKHLVDLGGATGHLAIAACERYGGMTATVVDLAPVLEHAKEEIGRSRAAGRISTLAADFFADELPEGDLYAVGRILHDWTEEKIRRLLGRIRAALPVGGGLLIAEAIVDEDGAGPVAAQMQSLNMLVCTEGRERTETEYRILLENEGFSDVECRRTGTPLDAILAIRKE